LNREAHLFRLEDLEWYPDQVASGMRSRAWPPHGEIIAYDVGDWMVSLPGGPQGGDPTLVSTAVGHEANSEKAKKRGILVYEAMTKKLEE